MSYVIPTLVLLALCAASVWMKYRIRRIRANADEAEASAREAYGRLVLAENDTTVSKYSLAAKQKRRSSLEQEVMACRRELEELERRVAA